MKFLEKNSKVSNGFIAATLLSIAGSIVIWNTAGADPAHVERLARWPMGSNIHGLCKLLQGEEMSLYKKIKA